MGRESAPCIRLFVSAALCRRDLPLSVRYVRSVKPSSPFDRLQVLAPVHPAGRSHDAFTADTAVGLPICRWRDEASNSWWWHAVFVAMACCAAGRYSPSASRMEFWRPRRDGQLGWTASSIILDWRLGVDLRCDLGMREGKEKTDDRASLVGTPSVVGTVSALRVAPRVSGQRPGSPQGNQGAWADDRSADRCVRAPRQARARKIRLLLPQLPPSMRLWRLGAPAEFCGPRP
jgi:hypothetical protein